MKILVCNVFVFLFLCQFLFAKSERKNYETVINVTLVDEDLDRTKTPNIKLQISAYPFGGIEFLRSKDLIYEQIALKEGNIFNISSTSDFLYLYIYYEGKKVPGGAYYGVDNIYIIKAGSRLSIELDKQSIQFSGEAAIIPNIQSEIIKHSYTPSEADLNLLNEKEYLRYFEKLDKSRDSALQVQLSIIESNKNVLGDYYLKLLIANCYGYRYYSQLRDYDYELMQNDVFFRVFKKYYSAKMGSHNIPKFSNEILDASPIFSNYLIEKLNILERISHDEYGSMLPDSCIRNFLQKINIDYSGILKDKLLTLFVLRTNKNANAAPFFSEILNSVKTEKYNDLLVRKVKVKEKDIPFRNFNLEDENGKTYTLNFFKDKVVVLDFWFTGCENCIILNKLMKPIIKHFNKNPRIEFVSISIDKNKTQWLKSIKSGDYTHFEGVNLYTNGEGSTHDLIKHYNITNYPTVFVIKDGLMFSSLPPRPTRKILSGQELSEEGVRLIDMLEKAVK